MEETEDSEAKDETTGRIFRNRCQNRTNGFSILKA